MREHISTDSHLCMNPFFSFFYVKFDDGTYDIMNGIKWPLLLEIKFIYSEKATKFCEIFILLLSFVVPVKSKVKISQNFVAFSEYMNFTRKKVNWFQDRELI